MLVASPDIVVVAGGASQATTIIHYVNRFFPTERAIVWERTNGRMWGPVELRSNRIFKSDNNDRNMDGYYVQSLRAGDLYEVRLYHDIGTDIDPNVQSDPPPDATLVVPALAGRDRLIVSNDTNQGGTWYRRHVTTNRPTNLFLQIGSSEPFEDSLGQQRFFSPLIVGFDALKTVHDLTLEPLMPGNDFFALVLVVDAGGKWEEFVVNFTTKQRKVTVDVSEMFIINDGAVSGIG
jgi:hypothetical protein